MLIIRDRDAVKAEYRLNKKKNEVQGQQGDVRIFYAFYAEMPGKQMQKDRGNAAKRQEMYIADNEVSIGKCPVPYLRYAHHDLEDHLKRDCQQGDPDHQG